MHDSSIQHKSTTDWHVCAWLPACCCAHGEFAGELAVLMRAADASCTMLQTAEKCKAAGASKVETHAADLTDLEGRERLISELLAKHTTVDVLVNNAGMGVRGTPLEGVA